MSAINVVANDSQIDIRIVYQTIELSSWMSQMQLFKIGNG